MRTKIKGDGIKGDLMRTSKGELMRGNDILAIQRTVRIDSDSAYCAH